MFESLQHQLGAGINQDMIDQQHILVSNTLKRQSERDFSRGSMRNGLVDGTKCQFLTACYSTQNRSKKCITECFGIGK